MQGIEKAYHVRSYLQVDSELTLVEASCHGIQPYIYTGRESKIRLSTTTTDLYQTEKDPFLEFFAKVKVVKRKTKRGKFQSRTKASLKAKSLYQQEIGKDRQFFLNELNDPSPPPTPNRAPFPSGVIVGVGPEYLGGRYRNPLQELYIN